MKPFAKEKDKSRLQTFISHSGLCSRREAMEIIFQGHVTVNGKTIREPSTPVDPSKDHVCVNGKPIESKTYHYILLNKPKGYITTVSDPHAERKVLDLLPSKFKHLYPVGRLDKDTEGLLVLTNDGELSYRLTHPKFNVEKVYLVTIQGKLKEHQKERLEKGVIVDGKETSACTITKIGFSKDKTTFHMTIHEGRKRQIRRMLSIVGYRVLHLKRIKQGSLTLDNLPMGQWKLLEKKEIQALKNAVGLHKLSS